MLARAKFRTKKEIAKLVRCLAPVPAVPDRVEPLGAAPMGTPREATWAQFVESLCPPVRELSAGDRPSDWVNESARIEVSLETRSQPSRAEIAAPATPARLDDPPRLYEIHFTTTAEHAELLERAKALLSHRSPKVSLGELHLQAMRLLVEALEKQRYGSPNDHVRLERRERTDSTNETGTDADSELTRAQRRGGAAPALRDPLNYPAN